MRENSTAIPVGDYQIVVVHIDAEVERFGRFETEDEAVQWATENRSSLALQLQFIFEARDVKNSLPRSRAKPKKAASVERCEDENK